MAVAETNKTNEVLARVPVSMRLPAHMVEAVGRYAAKHRMSKTDAYLYFLDRGMQSTAKNHPLHELDEIKVQLGKIIEMLGPDREEEFERVCQEIKTASLDFPAIARASLFGSFARKSFDQDSDIDIRIELDSATPFNLHDLDRYAKKIERATGRNVDVVSAKLIKNKQLAQDIETDKMLIYERETR